MTPEGTPAHDPPLRRELPVLAAPDSAPGSPARDGGTSPPAGGADPAGAPLETLREPLLRLMLRTVVEHGLVEHGDRILVAVSGGKDSHTLLDLLLAARRRAPVAFELVAFHLDQGQPGYDGRALRSWLEGLDVACEVRSEDTYSVVREKAAERGTSFCAPCSRLRRGILYRRAEAWGCNKVALGHHREDALETLLLNLLYAGRLQAMPARYRTNDGRFDVIRPLIECDEASIARYASRRGFPILPCNLCGAQEGLRRVRVRELIEQLEREKPDVRQVMMAALKNVRPSHLLDPEVAQAWTEAEHRWAPRR